MPRLVILGSSAGKASAHRAGSCYLFDLGDHGVMIDCGDGATQNFVRLGYDPEWVDHVVISHTHADHVGGLPYFLQQRYLAGTERPLTIHCPGEAVGPLKAILAFGYLFKERFPFKITYKPLVARWAVDLGGLRLIPFPTSHLVEAGRWAEEHGYTNRGECYAMRIEVGERVIVYSADLGSLDDLDSIPAPIDWLLVETSHASLDRLWPWVNDRAIRRVILTHISDDFDSNVLDAAKWQTSADVILAEDGLILDLGA